MPVKVRCTSCDKVLTVPDAARGKAVKCPQCETRIAVPAADSGPQKVVKSGSSKSAKKAPTAKSSKPVDEESAITSLDLRRVEDMDARICPKCGFDMQEMDEEETECPKCGYDAEAGGLGAKARRKQMRGPDPADFFPGLAKSSWDFMLKNQMLAWRTDLYTFICLLLSLFCVFMYLWISAWPPRVFFGLCFSVAFLVIPGWLWVLDTEVIKLTLERKDKFKKLNFDFFYSSASGMMSVAWFVMVAGPLLAIPGGLGYYLVYYSGQPSWVFPVCLGIGMIPVLWMLPIGMAHMTMPVPTPGWMVWRVATIWTRTLPAASVWLMWFFITNIPLIGGAAAIGVVWGNDLATIVQTMESNADINRRILAAENAPKGGKNPVTIDVKSIGEPSDVDFKPLIGPAIILAFMCLPIGFIALFNMRTNGQFTYYFKERLELIDKAREYKYVAKARPRGEDEEEKPRTLQQDLTDGSVIALVCLLLGGIGGMLYGNLTSVGMPDGIAQGVFWGAVVGTVVGWFILVGVVFPFKQNIESRKAFVSGTVSAVVMLVMLGLALGGTVSLGFIGGSSSAATSVPDPNLQAPATDMMPPAGGHGGGAPAAAPATTAP